MKKLFALVCASLLAFPALAGKWTLLWDKNPEPDVVSYQVFEIVGVSTNLIGIPSTNGLPIAGVSPGLHTYFVTAVNQAGIVSDPSTNGVFLYPTSPVNQHVGK